MYELHVERMTCGGCANSVKKSVHGIDGNATVDIDLKSKTVRIDTVADIDKDKAAVIGAGYPVTASTSL